MKLTLSLLVAATTLAANLSAATLTNYQAVVTSQSPSNYFRLDGSLESALNGSVVLQTNESLVVNGGFTGDVFRNPTNSYYFDSGQNNAWLLNLTDPLITGGGTSNSAASAKGSISFLFRALGGTNIGGQRWLFDATGTATGTTNHNAMSLFFENDTSTNNPNSLKLLFGDSTSIILSATNILYNTWYYFALTYDEARETNNAIWYLGPAGGVLSTGMTTNSDDAVAGGGGGLYIGQRASFGGAFRSPGSGRIDEFAIWGRELTVTEVSNQFAALPQPAPPGATYEQVVEVQIPKYYFKLNSSLVDSVGNSLVLVTNGTNGAFTGDFLGTPDSAYGFSDEYDGLVSTTDLFNGGGPNSDANASGVGTISFQFRMLSDTNNEGQRYLLSQGGQSPEPYRNQLAFFLESTNNTSGPAGTAHYLKMRCGNGPTSNLLSHEFLLTNAWHYFAITYDETRNNNPGEIKWYVGQAGGTLFSGAINMGDNGVVGDNLWIGFGNRIWSTNGASVVTNAGWRNPGSGAIDEIGIWHEELTAAEIQAQFAAMVPLPPVDVTLNIARAGNNVVLSWMAAGTAGFELESTASLSAPSWTGAGTLTLVGTNNVVTNAIAGTQFYRLRK